MRAKIALEREDTHASFRAARRLAPRFAPPSAAEYPDRALTIVVAGPTAAVRWQILGGFRTTHVPFAGWGETSPAVLDGHIDAAMAEPGEVKPLVDARKLCRLAVASPQRHPFFPGALTGKEAGLGDGIGTWFVLKPLGKIKK